MNIQFLNIYHENYIKNAYTIIIIWVLQKLILNSFIFNSDYYWNEKYDER